MAIVLVVLLIALILGGLGLAVHVLWWIALAVLVLWLLGCAFLRSPQNRAAAGQVGPSSGAVTRPNTEARDEDRPRRTQHQPARPAG